MRKLCIWQLFILEIVYLVVIYICIIFKSGNNYQIQWKMYDSWDSMYNWALELVLNTVKYEIHDELGQLCSKWMAMG